MTYYPPPPKKINRFDMPNMKGKTKAQDGQNHSIQTKVRLAREANIQVNLCLLIYCIDINSKTYS